MRHTLLGNKWSDRDSFVKKAGKYDLIAIALEEKKTPSTPAVAIAAAVKSLSCSLDSDTQDLTEFVFSKDMFRSAMSAINIDVQKLPLGALDQTQLDAGTTHSYAACSTTTNTY